MTPDWVCMYVCRAGFYINPVKSANSQKSENGQIFFFFLTFQTKYFLNKIYKKLYVFVVEYHI